jgi:23S rRNA pseudouridine2605 synthase
LRINRYIALYTDTSRRKADELITAGKVVINRALAHPGSQVGPEDVVVVDGKKIDTTKKLQSTTVLLHKPAGYVSSKEGQGSKTVYDLLPKPYQTLNIAGRLDKDSSGLMILTSDGVLLNELTHPRYDKEKVYDVTVETYISDGDIDDLLTGIEIGDGKPAQAVRIRRIGDKRIEITLKEGRNRQIRRMLDALNHRVVRLHRIRLGPYTLSSLAEGKFIHI